MKNYKSLILAAIVLAGSVLASCTKESYWDKAESKGYSLPASSLSYTFAPADEMTKVQIPIVRTDASGAATLVISGAADKTADAEYLSFPTSVEFAAGQSQAFYEISIVKPFDIGQSITATVKFDKALSATASVDSAKVKIFLDYNWEPLGKGLFNDAWTWGVSDFAECDFFQAVENPKIFKMSDPYTAMNKDCGVPTKSGYSASEFIQFQLLEPGDVIFGTTITKKGLVYFSPYRTGEFNSTYGLPLNAYHPAHFSSLSAESNFVNSKVLAYQENGLPAQVQFAPYYYMEGLGGWNYTTYSGVITFYFPDVPVYDYSIDLAYAGREIDVYDEMFVKAEVSVGADVDSVMFAMSTLDEESLLYAMLGGEVPTTTIAASDIVDGVVRIPMNDEGTGKYLLMAITFGGEDEESYDAQDYNYDQFAYAAGGEKETWVPVAGGVYTFSGGEDGTYSVASQVGAPQALSMNLYQSSINESKWRLWPYLNGEVIFFTDIYQGVYVSEGDTGLAAGNGNILVTDAYLNSFPVPGAGYFDPETDTFHLMVIWYDTTGWWAYGEDTFEVMGEPYEFTELATNAAKFSEKCKEVQLGNAQPMPKKESKAVKSLDKKVKLSKIDVID